MALISDALSASADGAQPSPAGGVPMTGLNPGGNIAGSSPANAVVINDSALAYTIAKGGTTTFGVHLASQPPANVTVNILVDKLTGSCTVSPPSLTFTTVNYGTDQTITVTGAFPGDSTIEANAGAGFDRAHVRVSVRG
jgi:hypothetical protein